VCLMLLLLFDVGEIWIFILHFSFVYCQSAVVAAAVRLTLSIQ